MFHFVCSRLPPYHSSLIMTDEGPCFSRPRVCLSSALSCVCVCWSAVCECLALSPDLSGRWYLIFHGHLDQLSLASLTPTHACLSFSLSVSHSLTTAHTGVTESDETSHTLSHPHTPSLIISSLKLALPSSQTSLLNSFLFFFPFVKCS